MGRAAGQAVAGRARAGPARGSHYPLLDAGRGVAALIVLAHHIGNETGWAIAKHGHLAVDYFLMLSGFVVAMRYEAPLRAGMSMRAFLGVRARRLAPMIWLGGLAATAAWALAPNPDIRPAWILLQFLLIPAMAAWVTFPLNGPMWSLFWECVANAAHGATLAFARTRTIAGAVVVLGAGAVAIVLAYGDYNWGFRPGEEGLALVRVFFGYLTGVLLWRLRAAGRLDAIELPGPVAAIVPMALIALPLLAPAGWSAPFVTIAALFLCFPLAILCSLKGAERAGGPAAWLGGLSYPLYALHMPVLLAGRALGLAQGPSGWMALGGVAVLAGWGAERWIDAPIRRRLRGHAAKSGDGRSGQR